MFCSTPLPKFNLSIAGGNYGECDHLCPINFQGSLTVCNPLPHTAYVELKAGYYPDISGYK